MADPTTYRTNRDLFSNYYLNDHLRETDPWNKVSDAEIQGAFEEIRELYENKKERVGDYNEAQLERNFIRPIFEILEISFEIEETVMRNARRPDYGFFPSERAADSAFDREDFYEEAIAVADAKRWGRKLDTRGEEKRDFENPSYQIHRYLQETPAQWAVLTNGESWRLYYGPTSHRLDSFYEINLPELLDVVSKDGNLEAFKEFYLFFRREAYLPDQSGDCFLDDVYDESSVFAEELGEDLQENIYEAIRVLAEGFLDTNDELYEEDLDLIHDSSLIYLYRLIFVLYAESEGRNLLPTDNEIYSGSYSLNELKQTVVENRSKTQQLYQTWQTNLWDRLDELFVLIDQGSQGQGIPKSDLYIPAYNGGLFRTSPDADDSDEAQFLAKHEVGDAYIAEVIELLTRHDASERDGKVFVDYSSLDERNLGSIYEGLLEYKLDIADEPLTVEDGEYVTAGEGKEVTVEEGEVYLRTDDGERKATGSYYTPEYIVEYIVDETLGPLVEEIREDLLAQSARGDERGFAEEFADQIFDLTVLDPAMGSGHFPVNAVDYLAREIIDAQEQQDRQAIDAEDAEVRPPTTEEGELRDINWARRKVAQRCIYGVDVNPLATELSKVSLWLRTLAAEQPLAFLDHHLKTGNSLVGSDIEDVLTDGDDSTTEDGQLTLQQSFDHTRKRAMEHVTDRFQDLLNIDNETLEDAKEMEAVYDDVRADPLYKKLLAMANVHTADAFGLDVPGDADERMARALHSDAWEKIEQQDWFKSAHAMAEDQRIFHWELEFPIAFYDQDGERKTNAGFDAVIGNPPWGAEFPEELVSYLSEKYSLRRSALDSFSVFTKHSRSLTRTGSTVGLILPSGWQTSSKFSSFRQWLVSKYQVDIISNLPYDVFEDAYVDSSIFLLKAILNCSLDFDGVETDLKVVNYDRKANINAVESKKADIQTVDYTRWFSNTLDPDNEYSFPSYLGNQELEIQERTLRESIPLSDLADIQRGITPFNLTEEEKGSDHAVALDGDLRRYRYAFSGKKYVEYHEDIAEYKPERYFRGERLILRELISRQFRIQFAYTNEDFITNKSYQSILVNSDEYSVGYILAVLNSKLLSFFHIRRSAVALRDDFPKIVLAETRSLPVRKLQFKGPGLSLSNELDIDNISIDSDNGMVRIPDDGDTLEIAPNKSTHDLLSDLAMWQTELKDSIGDLNISLHDHLGTYDDGQSLSKIGLSQPPENVANSILNQTTGEKPNLRIGKAKVIRESPSTVEICLTARYKPNDETAYETDQWGYTETEPLSALRITDISEREADLIEAFVPIAVDEGDGFANLRKTATKTTSLVGRLRGLILPSISDVTDGLESYLETKNRADELNAKIEKADNFIDEIVYGLYDLTEREIELVEEAVDDDVTQI